MEAITIAECSTLMHVLICVSLMWIAYTAMSACYAFVYQFLFIIPIKSIFIYFLYESEF